MTTIATVDGTEIASDTQCSWGGAVKVRVSKVYRLKDGGLLAGAGEVAEILEVLDWVETGKGKPPRLKNCDIMLVRPDGSFGSLCSGGRFHPSIGPLAIGSGMQAAMAAMVYFGASAEEAVMAAAEVDPNTSVPVEVVKWQATAKSATKRRKR